MYSKSIFVDSFQKKEGIIKHAQYTIKGHIDSNSINISRRYKEFIYLRRILTLNWPACVVPSIPAKQMIGNLDSNFLERRKALLSRFLHQISQTPYLFSSDEFQRFLFQHGDFAKIEFRANYYIEVAEKYHKIFNDFIHSVPDASTTENIHNFLNFCSISIPAFEKFEKACIVALDSLKAYQVSSDCMIEDFKKVVAVLPEITDIEEVKIPDRAEIANPFEELLFWTRGEILDTKAMIEAVQRLLSIPERKQEYMKKLEKKKKSYDNLKQGKSDLKDIFKNRSKTKSKKTLEFYELEVQGLETIEKTCIGKLMNIDLPLFKQQKIQSLSSSVSTFSSLMQSELGKMKHQLTYIRIK